MEAVQKTMRRYHSDNGTYSADLLGTATVNFVLRRAAEPATPWYLYLPFQSVHSPLEAPAEDLALYPQLQGPVQTRAAMISAMDKQVGAVTHALQQTEQMDDTIILFTADKCALPLTSAKLTTRTHPSFCRLSAVRPSARRSDGVTSLRWPSSSASTRASRLASTPAPTAPLPAATALTRTAKAAAPTTRAPPSIAPPLRRV